MSQPHETLEKLLEVAYAESFVNEYLFWETEKCGQILDEYSNGYIKYCNKHKYLHPDKNGSRRKQDCQEDHFFVTKNPNEIMEEQIFKLRFNIYLKYNRLLAQSLEHTFYKYLEQNCNYSIHYVESCNSSDLVSWLKKHPNSFRSKFPTYSDDQSKDKIYIKLYLANNEELPKFELISSTML